MEVSDDEAVIGGWVGDVLERGQLPLIQKSGGTKDIVDARVKPEETHFLAFTFLYILPSLACLLFADWDIQQVSSCQQSQACQAPR